MYYTFVRAMRVLIGLCVIGLGALGCGPSTATVATPSAAAPSGPVPDAAPAGTDGDALAVVPAPPRSRLVTVTAVSGEIEGLMPNGEQWDASGARHAQRAHSALADYLKAHPELADTLTTIGVPIDDDKLGKDARKSPAADPMVLVQLGDTVFRSPVRPRAFNPLWAFPFQFTVGPELVERSDGHLTHPIMISRV